MSDRSGHEWPPHTRGQADVIHCQQCGARRGSYAAQLRCPKAEVQPAPQPAPQPRTGRGPGHCDICLRPETATQLRARIRTRPSGPATVFCADCLRRYIAQLERILAHILAEPAPPAEGASV